MLAYYLCLWAVCVFGNNDCELRAWQHYNYMNERIDFVNNTSPNKSKYIMQCKLFNHRKKWWMNVLMYIKKHTSFNNWNNNRKWHHTPF